MLAFTTVVTLMTAFLFGMAPAFRAAGTAPIEALQAHGRGAARDGRVSVASVLVVAQVALSLVLVVAAALFMRTFSRSPACTSGSIPTASWSVTVSAQRTDIPAADRLAVFERIRQRVAAVPRVAAVGVSAVTPVSGMIWNNRVKVADGAQVSDRLSVSNFNAITPGWLTTFGTPLVAGRDVTAADRKGAPPVVLVNRHSRSAFSTARTRWAAPSR